MRLIQYSVCIVLLATALSSLVGAEDSSKPANAENAKAAEADFTAKVLPILKQHCFECHSHDSGKAQAGLVLDTRSGWAKGGENGPAIVPGRPDQSLLVSAIRHEDLRMPPKKKLPLESIRRIEDWIRKGAHDPRVTAPALDRWEAGRRHWAFQGLQKAAPPRVRNSTWPRSDVDRFVLAALERSRLKPAVDADRNTWLRRVSFDLTGLPPTITDVQAFVKDDSPRAHEKVVDRLLDSRAFGERWARHWLDLVGYADQIGTSNSVFAQHAWRYRDYVIDAFNSDKPYDRFVREQIAGDLMTFNTVEERAAGLVAIGFLVLGDIEIVEADKEKLLVDIVDQQVNKTGRAFLAMTIDCARCHDHKFDPISQSDYYAIGGFFHNSSTVYKTERGVWSDINVNDLPETEAQKAERARVEKTHADKLAAMKAERQEAQARKAELDRQLKSQELSKEDRDRLTKERNEKNSRIGTLNRDIVHAEFFAPTAPVSYGVHDVAEPANMRVTIRGNPRTLGDPVPRGFLSVISKEPAAIPDRQSGRLQLAEWMTDPKNPLTARVAVNRIWQKLFGEGIVRSVDYFGLPGGRPSHPKLLDFLASQFISDGWSMKRLIRSLVLSRSYRLASTHDEKAHAVDPGNRLLWRMNRVRLDAEALRDAMLFVSGQLKQSTGGPSMPLEFPENVGGLNPTDVNPPNFRFTKWRPGQEFERTVYLPIVRHSAQPGPGTLRNVFDFPQPSQFAGRRSTTAVPTQALFLMNSDVVKKQAAALAERISKENPDDAGRIQFLWLTLFSRPVTEEERQDALSFVQEAGEHGWSELCHALLASNEFLMRL